MVTNGILDNPNPPTPKKLRVHCFVDGFNLYHALDWFNEGKTLEEKHKYRKYKWISLTELAKSVLGGQEELVGVHLFTTVPTWDVGKQLRHRLFIAAQECQGVTVIHGAFRDKYVNCKAQCKSGFTVPIEKQTDVNIAIQLVDLAYQDKYDKALVISGDSDLIPAIKLIRLRFPGKQIISILPIGRRVNSSEIKCACHGEIKMNEGHLQRSLMGNQVINPHTGVRVNRPIEYLPVS